MFKAYVLLELVKEPLSQINKTQASRSPPVPLVRLEAPLEDTQLHTSASAEELWLGHDVKRGRLDTRPSLRVAQRRAKIDLLRLLDTIDPHLH